MFFVPPKFFHIPEGRGGSLMGLNGVCSQNESLKLEPRCKDNEKNEERGAKRKQIYLIEKILATPHELEQYFRGNY